MAKDRKKIQHIHSSVFDKQPTPESIELGELAVNANKNGSFISTKNTSNEVVRFSEDATLVDWMEYKEVFPYSAAVLTPTEQDLRDNKSQLLFKINQVVPTKTPYGSNVNGATDMHGNEINPISQDGTRDGAGFAVNMDIYAMTGGNPSFSSFTTTCGALLQGTTRIQGETGSCGSLLDIDVNEITLDGSAFTANLSDYFFVDGALIALTASGNGVDNGVVNLWGNKQVKLTAAENPSPSSRQSVIAMSGDGQMHILATGNICEESVSGDATFYGSGKTNIGIGCDGNSISDTTNVKGDKIIIDATDRIGITAYGAILNSIDGDITITANDNLCSTAGDSATFGGLSETIIGAVCDGSSNSTTTTIKGATINENGGNVNIASTASTSISANTTLCMEGNTKAALYGKETHIGINCDSGKTASSVTVNSTSNVTIKSPTTNITGNTNISGNTTVGGTLTINNGLGAKVCSSYGDVRSANGACSNLSGSTTTTFIIPNEFSHMKNHKNSDGSHSTDYYTFEYPIEINGTVTATAGIYSSDERLKENIKVVSRNDFNKAKRVQTKSFNFKDDPHKTKTYGVIAQDVEAVGLDELVYTKDDGFKAVDYTAFIMLKLSYLEDFCVNLSRENEELKQRIIDLENKK